eukprot:CAMPEP_0119274088 /NCGR_PEP_ID=MMETSP1329-20130426/11541_1 /TAXON_ID=114041 /ORGANISM="Genus nov. species nov., Strain RCC1024" /LENGTH=97 /DNA_ID=CAMNT_0007274373 /DNA_START=1 /DNA_END=291 /DNA_ORIENTATION=+
MACLRPVSVLMKICARGGRGRARRRSERPPPARGSAYCSRGEGCAAAAPGAKRRGPTGRDVRLRGEPVRGGGPRRAVVCVTAVRENAAGGRARLSVW